MGDSYVLDASVAAKLYFVESGSVGAQAAIRRAERLIAPAFLFLEMASIAAKNVRRGTASIQQAARAVHSLDGLLDETIATRELAPRAFELAVTHGFSVYDGAYLALAEARGLQVLTADTRLVRLAQRVGLGELVRSFD